VQTFVGYQLFAANALVHLHQTKPLAACVGKEANGNAGLVNLLNVLERSHGSAGCAPPGAIGA
jgi:hypothetical protein